MCRNDRRADWLDGMAMGYFVVIVLGILFFLGKLAVLAVWHICRWLWARVRPHFKSLCRRWALGIPF